jgi:hypothetical protein
MRWKIFYSDGTTYSDKDGDPFDAPARGVQVIIVEHPQVGRNVITKENNYWWTGERWFGGDLYGLYDYLQDAGPKKVIFGRIIDSVQYHEIVSKALIDPYLPPKTANLPGEKH